jgi:hypothetical protein
MPPPGPSPRWAYYTDQASRGVLLSQNLAYDIKCAAFHQHYGIENVVDNNVFAFVNDETVRRQAGVAVPSPCAEKPPPCLLRGRTSRGVLPWS